MCVPGCLEHVQDRLSRRAALGRLGLAGAALAATTLPRAPRAAEPRSFNRVVDLTHTLTPDFPTYFGKPQLEIEVLNSYAEHKFNMKKWSVVEHTGTHMDAPFHFSENGWTADQVPAENLVVPLVVIDIAARAAEDPDAQVTPDDIAAFEAKHGPLPDGCCVAMYSGWERHAGSAKFRNADGEGVMHFPGFHVEAAQMLMEGGRNVVGIAVDTLSLDYGPSRDFATHYAWLPTNRWGLENVKNLGGLPPVGATLVAGTPTVQGATGGPSRLFALV
jgi:kynurenine formamidase